MSQNSRTPQFQVTTGSRYRLTLARPIAVAFTVGMTLAGMTAMSPGANAAANNQMATSAIPVVTAATLTPIAPAVAGSSAAPRPIVQQAYTGLGAFDLQLLDYQQSSGCSATRTAGRGEGPGYSVGDLVDRHVKCRNTQPQR